MPARPDAGAADFEKRLPALRELPPGLPTLVSRVSNFSIGVSAMKSHASTTCPDCQDDSGVDRRQFLQGATTLAAVAATGVVGGFATPRALGGPEPARTPETAVKALYDTLSAA